MTAMFSSTTRADLTTMPAPPLPALDRKSTRLNSSHGYISYAVFCLKKKKEHRSSRVCVHADRPNSLPRLRTQYFYGVFYVRVNSHKLAPVAYDTRRGIP